jgi:Fe-S cluster assembly protein SufD
MPATIVSGNGGFVVPAVSKAERLRSREVDEHPIPNGREEDWRFTPMSALHPLLEGADATGELATLWTATGATVGTVEAGDPRLGSWLLPTDRASAVAYAASPDVLLVEVPAGTDDARVDLTINGAGGVSYTHTVVRIGPEARATVVTDHRGSATTAGNVEIDVADGAHLTYVCLNEWDDDAVQASTHAIRLGRDATVRHNVVSLGGALVRLSLDVAYTGPGADAGFLGVFFADAGQHLEHRLFIDHAVPRCTSNVEYRGALQGDASAGAAGIARSVWIGDVLIRAEAVGTSTYEMNRNLLLSEAARADSVPNLEIETGEIVGAGHASATGRFDDEQMFYLQARGIPPEEARRLVVRGFFADIISRIGVPDVQARVLASLDAELGTSDPMFASLTAPDGAEPS